MLGCSFVALRGRGRPLWWSMKLCAFVCQRIPSSFLFAHCPASESCCCSADLRALTSGNFPRSYRSEIILFRLSPVLRCRAAHDRLWLLCEPLPVKACLVVQRFFAVFFILCIHLCNLSTAKCHIVMHKSFFLGILPNLALLNVVYWLIRNSSGT